MFKNKETNRNEINRIMRSERGFPCTSANFAKTLAVRNRKRYQLFVSKLQHTLYRARN